MVELCDLSHRRMIPAAGGGAAGRTCWPSYLDQHVAQLDFDTSMMVEEDQQQDHNQSEDVFGSVMMGGDPSLISTDSLDIETLRARCENNQLNDYKLTFEDSGQWTTSGIGGSFTTNTTSSPPVPQSRKAGKLLRKEMMGLCTTTLDNHNLSLRLLEELNNAERIDENDGRTDETKQKWRNEFLDELLNNNNCCSSQIDFNNSESEGNVLTTWGRIGDGIGEQHMEPYNCEKNCSLPELNRRNGVEKAKEYTSFSKGTFSSPAMVQRQKGKLGNDMQTCLAAPTPPPSSLKPAGHQTISSSSSKRAPTSLVGNFIDRQQQKQQNWEEPADYVYSETYLGNGLYIDVNENEIGYVPPNTAPIQRTELDLRRRELLESEFAARNPNPSSSPIFQKPKRYGSDDNKEPEMAGKNCAKNHRTFADLSGSRTVPDLKFIQLSHKVPSICPSSNSLDKLLNRAKDFGNLDELIEDCTDSERFISGVDGDVDVPDSGLGSSHSEGPSHIEDWSSLSVLLPRNVLEAFSFFKSNSFLLTGSSNNIEGRRPLRSFTCANGIWRLKDEQRPLTVCRACLLFGRANGKNCLDCCMERAQSEEPPTTKSVFAGHQTDQSPRTDSLSQKLRLHSRELSIIGLPIYDQKRNLIERIVEGVAEIIRGASSVVLMTALERLLSDEILPGIHIWSIICKITGQGPVTRCVYQLIQELEASEKPEHSRVSHFFKGLLALHSLDGWLSYIVLKESVLCQFYSATSFLRGAQSSYRSLYWRLMESVELLSVLNQTGGAGKRWERRRRTTSPRTAEWEPGAAQLPRDSRVPKSSSLPTRLARNSEEPIEEKEEEKTTKVVELVEHEEEKEKHKEVDISEKNEQKKQDSVLHSPRPSRIPVFRMRSPSSNSASTSHLTIRSSSNSRKTPAPITCPISEESCKNDNDRQATTLPMKAKSGRMLSLRGAYTRYGRFRQHTKRDSIVTNYDGLLPTRTLDIAQK